MVEVVLKNIEKSYKNIQIIKELNLHINPGELVVFVGPSGCGKSTLLRMIAGLEEVTSGNIFIDNEDITDIEPADRGVAMVFQSYALYPHMSVYDNMAFSLKLANVSKDEIANKIEEVAEVLQIADLLQRLPKQLSGGQRQRVAIGRAIIRNPKVFLFDEPLSNLDASLRIQTRIEIERLHKKIKTTMIYVTHDQVEAMTLADRVVVLNGGNIEQVDSPDKIYNHPKNLFVANFIGNTKINLIDASIKDNVIIIGDKQISINQELPDANITLGIRPEDVFIANKKSSIVSGTIDIIENLGEYKLIYVLLPNSTILRVKDISDTQFQYNDSVHLGFDQQKIHLFNERGDNMQPTTTL